jgi:hypothetical protein
MREGKRGKGEREREREREREKNQFFIVLFKQVSLH